jgi:hypothetical protein
MGTLPLLEPFGFEFFDDVFIHRSGYIQNDVQRGLRRDELLAEQRTLERVPF